MTNSKVDEKEKVNTKDEKKPHPLDVARMDGEGAAQGASFQKKETKSLK